MTTKPKSSKGRGKAKGWAIKTAEGNLLHVRNSRDSAYAYQFLYQKAELVPVVITEVRK